MQEDIVLNVKFDIKRAYSLVTTAAAILKEPCTLARLPSTAGTQSTSQAQEACTVRAGT